MCALPATLMVPNGGNVLRANIDILSDFNIIGTVSRLRFAHDRYQTINSGKVLLYRIPSTPYTNGSPFRVDAVLIRNLLLKCWNKWTPIPALHGERRKPRFRSVSYGQVSNVDVSPTFIG